MPLTITYNKIRQIIYDKTSLSIWQKARHYMKSLLSRGGASRYACRQKPAHAGGTAQLRPNASAQENSCKKAVLTVETAVVLPFFVCFLVFLLYFFRILQIQAGVAQALQYAGRKTAAEYNAQTGAGDAPESESAGEESMVSTGIGLVKAELYFRRQMKKQQCPTQYIKNGMAGISLLQSDFSGNYVELKAIYKMKLPVGLLGNIQYRIVQGETCRKWTGYQPGQDTEENDTWLYYTEYGTVYHASRSCTHLDLSIRGVTYAQAGRSRNSSGGKYHACEKCGGSGARQGMVYVTNYGDRYHSSLSCSGLKRSVYMIRKSKATEKRMCRKCGG